MNRRGFLAGLAALVLAPFVGKLAEASPSAVLTETPTPTPTLPSVDWRKWASWDEGTSSFKPLGEGYSEPLYILSEPVRPIVSKRKRYEMWERPSLQYPRGRHEVEFVDGSRAFRDLLDADDLDEG
jgi:hypothetical protein